MQKIIPRTQAAATRTVEYWNIRRKVFGDKAFLPMDLTGTGALPPDVIDSLKCGRAKLLRPDPMGRTVLYFQKNTLNHTLHDDFRRRLISVCSLQLSGPSRACTLTSYPHPSSPPAAQFQILFYLLAVASESELAQKHGFIFVLDNSVRFFPLRPCFVVQRNSDSRSPPLDRISKLEISIARRSRHFTIFSAIARPSVCEPCTRVHPR